MNNLQHITALENFICNNKDLAELEKMFEKFNIFDCLKLSNNEIRHSNFLGWLLNPSETHGFGDYFLKEFLKKVLYQNKKQIADFKGSYNLPSIFDIDTWDMSDIEVRREFKNIDILLIDETNKFILVIENKIWTSQHDNQLSRYKSIVDEGFSDDEYKKLCIYLKPDFEKVEEPYIYVSYSAVIEAIASLLEDKKDKMSVEIFTIIAHYKEILERDIMKEDDIKAICKRIYSNHKTAIDLINKYANCTNEISELLKEVIRENSFLDEDTHNGRFVRCIPKQCNIADLKICHNWTSSKLVMLIEFVVEKSGLKMDLVLGSTNDKKELERLTKCLSSVFKKDISANTTFNHVVSYKIIDDYSSIISLSREEIKKHISDEIEKTNLISSVIEAVNNFRKE